MSTRPGPTQQLPVTIDEVNSKTRSRKTNISIMNLMNVNKKHFLSDIHIFLVSLQLELPRYRLFLVTVRVYLCGQPRAYPKTCPLGLLSINGRDYIRTPPQRTFRPCRRPSSTPASPPRTRRPRTSGRRPRPRASRSTPWSLMRA